MQKHYYSYNQYLRKTFGVRTQRLSLDAGFSCPNIDGTLSSQGCTFCNNKAFSRYTSQKKPIKQQIEESMQFTRKRYKAKKFIAYFQSFTNTYADLQTLCQKYNQIKGFEDIVGISVSTRPDCINKEKLDLLAKFNKDYKVYIEYGLQSIHDKTLKKINRQHNFKTFTDALKLTKQYENIYPAAHIILGLPGETKKDMLTTAKTLAKMPLWGLKIHCLHVVKDTALEQEYYQNQLKLLSQKEYLNILIDFLKLIPKDFVILRLVSDANPSQLIAPKWLNQKSKVLQKLDKRLEKENIWQGKLVG
ncbi:MAG: TIGR01212 family radical SAM protein [Candidatus Omnitrophica bacterium]|nr:TIGR01212 family radical SAM protein [Candidatus Omnitrophota bacterium]MCF7893856.1 TIGR01212 family radical SAM protein [Candidatus Omnitrophota bacterium]